MTGERDFLVGKRVTVIGLGIEGVDVARFAASQDAASVTVIDRRPAEALGDRIEELRGFLITYALGPDVAASVADAAANADIIFATQSVSSTHPLLTEARDRGIPISSMTQAFLERCPGPTIGITGSSGKTTTTALVAHILATAGVPYRVGGNVGVGLLGLLDGMDARTFAVMEISHTQLQLTTRSPHIAAVLNVTPNHLDQFSWDDYVALKQNLVRYQGADDIAVLNLDEPISAAMAALTPAQIWRFTTQSGLPGNGSFILEGSVDETDEDSVLWGFFIALQVDGVARRVLPIEDISLRGEHNVQNVLAATAIAGAAGVAPDAIAEAIRTFRPVPHRLEDVGEVDGARYVNDSIATTPERALAGIRSFTEPLVLLLGGKDKDLPKDELAQEALRRCSGIVFFGADGALLEAAVEANAATVPFEDRPLTVRVETLAEAVGEARDMAEPGDVVLLSPACTSFDAYAGFEERGEEFRRLVAAMAAEAEAR